MKQPRRDSCPAPTPPRAGSSRAVHTIVMRNDHMRLSHKRFFGFLLPLACFVMAPCLSACEDQRSRVEKSYALAAAPTGGRGAAAAAIVSDHRAKTLTIGAAMDFAFQKLTECEKAGSPATLSTAATDYAGAVLDAISQLGTELPQAAEFELMWMQVGRLAFKAAEEAHASGRLPDANSLILAGGTRWQHDAYWERYSDHDALVAVLLAKAGDRGGAIHRLRSRVELNGVAAEVYQMLIRADK